ncbi:uncharacterized protein [Euwallacea similis]|uniref:uncharacterized protein isoform X3 n=1 Tax=Euwallacea similis TaxID=1736056 RepID=UPI00344F6DC0
MLPNALFWRLLLRVSVLLFFIRAVISTDEYVKDLRKKCMKTKRPFFCVTFRIAKYVQEFDYHGPPYGPLKLVKIKQEGLAVGDLLPTPRFVSTDTEWDKFVKFLQRKLVNFVTSHGIAFEVPQGIQVVGERSFSEVEGTIQDKSHEERQFPVRYNVSTSLMPLSNLFVIKRTRYNSTSDDTHQLQSLMPIAALANFYIFGSAVLSFMIVYAMVMSFNSS